MNPTEPVSNPTQAAASSGTTRAPWAGQWAGWLLIALGALLRLYQSNYSFDGDEIFSVALASKSFAEMIAGALQDRPHPPLHNLLLYAWVHLLGTSEVAARSLSVLFSAGFLALSLRLFRRFMPGPLAVGLVALLAVSPLFVYYGQQARPYTLIAFFTAANLLTYVQLMDAPTDRRRHWAWAATCVALLHCQYIAVLTIGLEMLVALFWLRRASKSILIVGTLACASIAPWFLAAMLPTVSSGVDPLYHIAWITKPTAVDLAWLYVSIFGTPLNTQARWILLGLCPPVAAYAFSFRSRRLPGATESLMLLTAFALPAFVLAVSIWGPKPVFASRQLLGSCLAFVLLLGVALARLPRSWAGACVVGLLAWSVASLHESIPSNSKPPWQAVVQRLADPGIQPPLVATEGWVPLPLAFYKPELKTRIWTDLTDQEKRSGYFLLCRGFRCAPLDGDEYSNRRKLLNTWQWGRADKPSAENTLKLYQIQPAN